MFLDERSGSLSILRGYLAGRTSGSCNFRQPKIQNFGVPSFGKENIGRLDVAMDDTGSVSGVKRVGDVDGDGEQILRFQRTPGDAMFQRHTIQKFHDDERLTFMLADLIDRTDIGMVQS
jgi:hypothetical protein